MHHPHESAARIDAQREGPDSERRACAIRKRAALHFERVTGVKIAAAVAVIGAVFAEWAGSDRGLGHTLLIANGQLETARAFAATLLLFALAAQHGATMTLALLVLVILALDLLAMIYADRILKLSALRYGLILIGMILGVLQVALAIQTIANAARELNGI